ncbi:MAG: ATP-binding cassette domain-containing protein [Acidimicrobiales bacterium]
MIAVEVHELVKLFGTEVRAVDGVSFEVEAGTVFGLLGPNGAGKTTIVRILATIIPHDAGVARVLGHDVASEAQVVRSLIGLAGQFATVDENLTGKENLQMIGRLNHLPWPVVTKRTSQLLERFDLTGAAGRPAKTYSGGMRRRLDVAAALVAKPRVLFLDEPTTGLDPQSRADVWSMIEDLVHEGTTVLLTTQYLEEADRLADHLVVIDHGKLIAEGTPASLKAGLGATVLDIGMADTDSARRAAEALRDIRGLDPSIEGTTVELNVDDGPGVVSEALRVLQDCNLAPATLALREPSLDDVFIALTGHRTDSDPTPSDDGGRPKGATR